MTDFVLSQYVSRTRVVALGDLHGDYDRAVRCLQVAGVVDDEAHWCGGGAVAVQVGECRRADGWGAPVAHG